MKFQIKDMAVRTTKKVSSNLAAEAAHPVSQPVKRLGFTLAEVLITLGIIGVVAAMTIPNLMAKYNDIQNASKMKEVYSILQQMMISANDAGAIEAVNTNNEIAKMKSWFQEYFLPYIKVSAVCYDTAGCWHGKTKTPAGLNNDVNQSERGCGFATVSFVLNNGAVVCMDDFGADQLWTSFGVKSTAQTNLAFYIDLNGSSKPNILGKDIFIAVFDAEKGTFVPAGNDRTKDEIRQNCSKTGTGYYCLAKVIDNSWEFPAYK